MFFFVILLINFNEILTIQDCLNENVNRNFFKLRDCAKSTAPMISFANYRNLDRCLNYAMSRNALAVNFSPPEAAQFRDESYKSSCQILACPEIIENNLVNDSAYDYYTFYKNLTEEFTCVKSVGVYRLFKEKSNYIQAINTCLSLNGDLAQVQSDVLTNTLATLISGGIKNWTKVAFVGLDDYWSKRGNFVTSFGNRLNCYKYRAWAPGHPRLSNKQKNCVVLDANKTWKVTGCRNRFPFLCEIHPHLPIRDKNKECSTINDLEKKKKCEKRKIEYREDICGLI